MWCAIAAQTELVRHTVCSNHSFGGNVVLALVCAELDCPAVLYSAWQVDVCMRCLACAQ